MATRFIYPSIKYLVLVPAIIMASTICPYAQQASLPAQPAEQATATEPTPAFNAAKIYSTVTIENEKFTARHQRLIDQANSLDTVANSNHEAMVSALWAVGQFLINTPQSQRGIQRLSRSLLSLNLQTQRALLEAIHGIYPTEYLTDMQAWLPRLNHPKTFSIAASYIYKAQPAKAPWLIAQLRSKFANWASQPQLSALMQWLQQPSTPAALPPIDSLLAYQRQHGFKIIYSFQRPNRNYPGLAVVQLANGQFARHPNGQLKTFTQLARAASNMPYFINNGNTPQGLYAITGTAVSRNPFIGPTPNLQMVMMGEVNPPAFTHYQPLVFNAPPERLYRSYFPPAWQQWPGLMEAYQAGKLGRSEIIAHGTTISPTYFAGQPYYPISPTLGCLCGLESWNPYTGYLERSSQLDLVNTWLSTPGQKGYLMVIELPGVEGPVLPEHLEAFITRFEQQVWPGLPAVVKQQGVSSTDE